MTHVSLHHGVAVDDRRERERQHRLLRAQACTWNTAASSAKTNRPRSPSTAGSVAVTHVGTWNNATHGAGAPTGSVRCAGARWTAGSSRSRPARSAGARADPCCCTSTSDRVRHHDGHRDIDVHASWVETRGAITGSDEHAGSLGDGRPRSSVHRRHRRSARCTLSVRNARDEPNTVTVFHTDGTTALTWRGQRSPW